jgi:serine/threonine-protein kinase
MPDPITRLNEALEGRYRIERELGEGGMATVYLARDEKHNRNVALKVLKPELAAVVGAERFLAEIETTANLQHPHILPLFDSGKADSFLFYVMPYIEGETLRDKIDREKQLPVDEALGIATAVANALHVAHEVGVVHRDIKPGNILLSRGEPLVADFGIALAVGAAGGSRLTETGLSVGTPFYMSPEQATGDQAVGAASDTYALACVLYEMLVGEPPYLGNTAQAVLGKIIQGAPVSATAARKSIPFNVDAAIRKALEKIPADRFRDAREFAKALADPSFRHGETAAAIGVAPTPARRAGLVGGWAVAAILGGLLLWQSMAPQPDRPVRRFAMPFEAGQEMTFLNLGGFALSPDGSTLVYRHNTEGNQILMARRWDELASTPIRESEGAFRITISPEGQEIAFQSPGGEIRALALAGGPVRTLGEGAWPVWGHDGHVYFTSGREAFRVPSAGGAAEVFLTLGEGETAHRFTDALPSGDRALHDVLANDQGEVRILDLESGEERTLAYGSWGKFAAPGYLLYLTDGTLMGAPLDADAMELTGTPAPLISDVLTFFIAEDGSLFYSTGAGGGGTMARAVWMDRAGEITPIDPAWTFDRTTNPNDIPALSPDGTRLALREFTEDGFDIWIKQLPAGVRTRVTLAEDEDRMAVWHPDGREIIFISSREGDRQVWMKRADGIGEARLFVDFDMPVANAAWTPDGAKLLLRTAGTGGVEGGRDIYVYDPESGDPPQRLLAGDFDEGAPAISPDGRWLAYTSNESNRWEVYVRPFPDVESGRWQVSTDGGRTPKWSHDGDELFFLDNSNRFVAVAVETDGGFRANIPQVLFTVPPYIETVDLSFPYDVALDDERFVMLSFDVGDDDDRPGPRAVLVQNFAAELQARIPR